MALELNGTTGVSLVQDGVVTAADLSSTLDLSSKTLTLPTDSGNWVEVSSGTLSGNSTVTVDGAFTTTYRNYRMYINFTNATTVTDGDLDMRYRNGGSTDSSTNYEYRTEYWVPGGNSGTAVQSANTSNHTLYDNYDTNARIMGFIDFYSPAHTDANAMAMWTLQGIDNGTAKLMFGHGRYENTTAQDGLYLSMSAYFNGSYKIYGIK